MKRILIGATLAVAGIVGVAGASSVSADNHQTGVCEGTHIKPDAGATSVKVTADPGELISGYCVKAGSETQEFGGPEYKYFTPPVTSVEFSHSTGKEISHYVVYYVEAPATETTAAPTTAAPTTAAPTTAAPTTEAPTTSGPENTTGAAAGPVPGPTDVASAGPTPPAAPQVGGAAPFQAAPAPTQLPATGTSSWGLAMTALASLLGGLGLTKLARRHS